MNDDSGPVSLNARQRKILGLARSSGTVEIEDLVRRFDVTPQTVRRDINQLCGHNLLERHHGGAALPGSVENIHYGIRRHAYSAEKKAIAEQVVEHIPDHASLFINVGTTMEAVALALSKRRGLKVITNNLNVAVALTDSTDFEVIVAGGLVRRSDKAVIGASAVDMIEQFKVDIAVIGISGIDLDGALLDFDYREVRVAQAIIRNARRVFLAADHTKFGRGAMVRMGHLSQIHALFTDRPPPRPLAEIMKQAGLSLHLAESG